MALLHSCTPALQHSIFRSEECRSAGVLVKKRSAGVQECRSAPREKVCRSAGVQECSTISRFRSAGVQECS